MIFRSEWTKLKYTLNLVSWIFFYGFKSQLSNSYDNWYIQKYLKGIFYKGMHLIWKEYFTCAILSFSSPRCAIIARLNVIYTKFRRAMISQLNKIWRVRVRSHATHGQDWAVIYSSTNWPPFTDGQNSVSNLVLKLNSRN